jgi:hypothetical protein
MYVLTGGHEYFVRDGMRDPETDGKRSGEKYDPETDTWSHIPDMSRGRSNFATAVIDDKILAIGGGTSYTLTNGVEYFSEEENKWFVYSSIQNINTSYTGSF